MLKKSIKVLYVSAELNPLAKVGGLGDVAGSLPKELLKSNIDIRVALPFYSVIKKKNIKTKCIRQNMLVPFGNYEYLVDIFLTTIPNSKVPVYLFRHNHFFKETKIYGANKEKFMFFTQCLKEFLKLNIFQTQIIHLNDSHAGNLIPLIKEDEFFKNANYKYLLSIHNLAMQGIVPNYKTKLWHPSLFKPRATEYNTIANLLYNADLINTVSPQYAKDILTNEYSFHLDKQLHQNKHKISGIINGIDYNFFGPDQDKYIYKKYNINTLSKKIANKKFLQKKCRLEINENIPIIGLVSRLQKQKGIDLIDDIADELMQFNAQFIFTGVGNELYENNFKQIQHLYPKKFYYLGMFDVAFGQYIYAGADMFLMPSWFEPCGLGQMIAMAYGTIPIVRATGGLKDTVKDGVNGFSFNKYDAGELLKTIKRAIKAYENKTKWNKMVCTAMKQDFSWKKSALEYKKLYLKLLK
ncbi:MAG: glycogen/starch synthase [Patescibacteria group bacterium]|jgi:starch synthase